MDLAEWIFGSDNEIQKLPTGSKQQQKFGEHLIKWLRQMHGEGGGQNLANQYDQNLLGGGPEAFQQFAEPYNQQFENKVIPGIAERFAGAGALSSSGFGQALGGAASDFQTSLAQLFSSLQSGAAGRQQGQFQNLSGQALGYQPFAYLEKQGKEGFAGNAAEGLIQSWFGG